MHYVTIAIAVVLVLVFMCFAAMGLITAMESAQAAAAIGTASAVQATSSLVNQCMTGFLVVIGLLAGGLAGAAFSSRRRERLPMPTRKFLRAGAEKAEQQLPPPETVIWLERPSIETLEEDVLFRDWGGWNG